MGLFSNVFGNPSSPEPPPLPTSNSPSQEAERIYEEGLRLCKAGQPQEGMRKFVRAIEIDPKCVDACVALARGFYAMNSEKYSDQVLALAEQAFRADPTNPKARNLASFAHFEKGKIAMHRGNWREATSYFKRSHELDPGDENAFMSFRHCSEKADQLDIFADACEGRLKAKPDDHAVRLTLGRTYIKMSLKHSCDRDQQAMYKRRAEAHLLAFLLADPLSIDGNFNLGVVYIIMGRLNEASHIVTKLREFDSAKSKELEELLTE